MACSQSLIKKMKNKNLNWQMIKISGGLMAGILMPGAAYACACGCGVFDVATSSMFPESSGGTAFLNYNYQNQNQNWSGTSSAPGANNDDKKIETHFVTAGLQYMFNRSWGAQIELPVVNRTFDSAANAGPVNWTGLGDIRLKGIYTGFSEDLSSGVTFGLKLPTGSYTHDPSEVDRDTQIGSGSTDFLLGGFYRHALVSGSHWQWFAQAELDAPFLIQGDYRPGLEVDAAAGIDYRGWNWGQATIAPIAQVIGSVRGRDNGAAAAPDDSGYQRILLAPGLEVNLHPFKFYADVEIPVYQNMKGNQLVAPALFKVSLSYMF
jgi:hypothetical protein